MTKNYIIIKISISINMIKRRLETDEKRISKLEERSEKIKLNAIERDKEVDQREVKRHSEQNEKV